MEKRLISAVVLSALVLLIWSAIMPKNKVSEIPQKTQTKTAEPVGLIAPIVEDVQPSPLLKFTHDKSEIFFTEKTASIKEVIFNEYRAYAFSFAKGFSFLDKSILFDKKDLSNQNITFLHKDESKSILKNFIFHNSLYSIDLDIKIENLSNSSLDINYPIVLGIIDSKPTEDPAHLLELVVSTGEKIHFLNGRKEAVFGQLNFVALRDRYFCFLIEPDSKGYSLEIKKDSKNNFQIILIPPKISLAAGKEFEEKFRGYLGPQQVQLLQKANPAWAGVINYGNFDLISHFLLQILGFLYNLLHNWGLALIALSIVVYLLLYPLTAKQMRSMKEMQALQPRIEELKKLYRDNPQKLHKETLELYKEHKVNPFGGCLPLLLQMPIFFALYQALVRSISLKGANFLWIKDLSEPDRLFVLPVNLPFLKNEINILPISMAILMFFQQKASMANTSSEYAEQQKAMLIILPLIFGLVFYHMPSGLVLYWFVNSLLSLFYQVRMYKK